MREKLKNNTKIKLIALLSAVVLWMYVMAVVDPEETSVFEGVPITITNMDELEEKDLIIYPDAELTTNVYVTGKLSVIQKIKKEDISVSGEIRDPIEGKNEIYLRATQSPRVTYEFKNQVAIVNLEKIVQEKRDVKINIEGSSKDDIDTIELQNAKDGVIISGPRSLVQQVNEVRAVLNIDNKVENFETTLVIEPTDENGDIVQGVDLDVKSVKIRVSLLKEKVVPIKIKFTEGIEPEVNLKDYKLSQDSVTIKGKKELIEKIEYISTQPVNLADVNQNKSKDINLEIPLGVACETKYITIKSNNIINKVSNQFTYSSEDVKILNGENVDLSNIKIPQTINVTVEYNDNIGTVNKEDITLYIDLNQENIVDEKYEIKYKTNYELNTITINPNITE